LKWISSIQDKLLQAAHVRHAKLTTTAGVEAFHLNCKGVTGLANARSGNSGRLMVNDRSRGPMGHWFVTYLGPPWLSKPLGSCPHQHRATECRVPGVVQLRIVSTMHHHLYFNDIPTNMQFVCCACFFAALSQSCQGGWQCEL